MSVSGDLDAAVAQTLEACRIKSLPTNFYYIPDFISKEEETSILNKIPAQRWITLSRRRLQAHPSVLSKTNTLLGAPLPRYLVSPIIDRFKQLEIFAHTPHQAPNHVLINEYKSGEGIMPHEDGDAYAGIVATVSLGSAGCLDVDWKGDGASEGHGGGDEDRDKEEGLTEVLEGPTVDDSQSKSPIPSPAQATSTSNYRIPTRILYEPRSLLITTGSAYTSLLHGISPVTVDENLNAETIVNWELLGDRESIEESGGRIERGTRISLTYRDVLKVSSAASKVFGGLGKR